MIHNILAGGINRDVQRRPGSLACRSTLQEPGGKRGLHDLVEMACHSAGTITTSSAFDIRDCIVVAPVAERSERRFDRVTHKTMLAAFLVRKGDSRCTRDVSPRGRGTRGAGGKEAASCRLRIPGRI